MSTPGDGMSNVQHTSTGLVVRINGQALELRIHSDETTFKVIPRGNSTAWRELNNLLYPDQPVREAIPLEATNALAADTKLRGLIAKLGKVEVEQPTHFRYTKGRVRFLLVADSADPTTLSVKLTSEDTDCYDSRLASFVVALKLSPFCRSAELQADVISVTLAPRYSIDTRRLATYEAVVELYK